MGARSILVLKRTRGLGEEAAQLLWEAGTLGVWEISSREWKAFFEAPVDGLAEILVRGLPGLRTRWERDGGTDWAARFQATLKPVATGDRFAVLPAPGQESPWRGRSAVRLAPGMAFGTGEHFSTASCLRLLEKVAPVPETVFDVGCGSGILAIAACLLGAADVAACDTDAEAVRIAEENALANQVHVDFRTGGPETFTGPFDCVLANIQAEILSELMPTLRERVRSRGTLILAGILWEKLSSPLLAAQAEGFVLKELRSDGRWASLRMVG
jgi:ribosomal protein L11 methyltransferase